MKIKPNPNDMYNVRKCSVCGECRSVLEFYGKRKQCKSCGKKKNMELRFRVSSYIYIISNPAWNGIYKLGRAKNISNRLRSYNTYSPYNDFKVEWCMMVNDVFLYELYAENNWEKASGEWYYGKLNNMISDLVQYKKLLDEQQE